MSKPIEQFLRDLSDVCREHGFGITGNATLFIMEPEDAAIEYKIDAESNLTVG
jgi:hypothetical protein